MVLQIITLDKKESDLNVFTDYLYKLYLYKGITLCVIDCIYVYTYTMYFNFFTSSDSVFYTSTKVKQLDNNNIYIFNNKIDLFSLQQLLFYGLQSVWGHLRL